MTLLSPLKSLPTSKQTNNLKMRRAHQISSAAAWNLWRMKQRRSSPTTLVKRRNDARRKAMELAELEAFEAKNGNKLMKFLYGEENYKNHDNCLTKFMKKLYGDKYVEKKKKWKTMYYGESYNAQTELEERLEKFRKSRGGKDKLFNRLSKFGVYEGTTEMGLKSVGRIYNLVDKKKSLGEAKEEIGKALLGLDTIEMGSKVDESSFKLETIAEAVYKMLPLVLQTAEDLKYLKQYGCPRGGGPPRGGGGGGGGGGGEGESGGGGGGVSDSGESDDGGSDDGGGGD